MYRSGSWRPVASNLSSIATATPRYSGRRFASSFITRTATRATGRLARLGLAGAAVYYYNTSNLFADEPRYAANSSQETSSPSETYSSIDAIADQRRAQAKKSSSVVASTAVGDEVVASSAESPQELQEEAAQQGAFNEETGEINWDCPCLGGMAHGPCGEQFQSAFSCFVFSKEEPKGIDCIEHFKTMQDCFRQHPDIYGAELDDDEGVEIPSETDVTPAGPAHAIDVAREKINDTVERTADAISADASKVTQAVRQTPSAGPESTSGHSALPSGHKGDESSDTLTPRAWHDSTGDNDKSRKTAK